jgi:hypothetical protein
LVSSTAVRGLQQATEHRVTADCRWAGLGIVDEWLMGAMYTG